MERSTERAAENEAAFRRANEQIDQRREEFQLTDKRSPYICECEEETCTEVFLLALDEYEHIRASPRRFVVSPGHESGGDVPIAGGNGFVVIEKTGREGELVEQKDPRGSG
jgi:hypothetical protein